MRRTPQSLCVVPLLLLVGTGGTGDARLLDSAEDDDIKNKDDILCMTDEPECFSAPLSPNLKSESRRA